MAVNNVLNTGAAIILGGTLQTAGAHTLSGAFASTFTFTASTSVTFPTSGTLATTSQPLPFTTISGTSQNIAVGNGYIANNGSLVTFTLPTTAAIGDVFAVEGLGAGGWSLVYGTGQSIRFGNQVSTTTSGSVSSSNQYDGCMLICITTDTLFKIVGSVGNLTIA